MVEGFLERVPCLAVARIRIGDRIVLVDFEGTVEEIQTRATFLRTYD